MGIFISSFLSSTDFIDFVMTSHFKRFLSPDPERIWSLLNFNIIIIITLRSISFKSRINSPRTLHIFNVFQSFFMKCLYSLNFNLSAYVFDAVDIEGRHLYYTLYLSAVLLFNQTHFTQDSIHNNVSFTYFISTFLKLHQNVLFFDIRNATTLSQLAT